MLKLSLNKRLHIKLYMFVNIEFHLFSFPSFLHWINRIFLFVCLFSSLRVNKHLLLHLT